MNKQGPIMATPEILVRRGNNTTMLSYSGRKLDESYMRI